MKTTTNKSYLFILTCIAWIGMLISLDHKWSDTISMAFFIMSVITHCLSIIVEEMELSRNCENHQTEKLIMALKQVVPAEEVKKMAVLTEQIRAIEKELKEIKETTKPNQAS